MRYSENARMFCKRFFFSFICLLLVLTSFPFASGMTAGAKKSDAPVRIASTEGEPVSSNVYGNGIVTKRISNSYLGARLDETARDAYVSGDGKSILYASRADEIVAGFSPNGNQQVYRYHTEEQITEVVSRSHQYLDPANGWTYSGEISTDGRYVAFISAADNVTDGTIDEDTNGKEDIFVRDMKLNTTVRASLSNEDVQLETTNFGNGNFKGLYLNESYPGLALSGNGRHVLFLSASLGVTTDATPTIEGTPAYPYTDFYNLYVRDLDKGTTTLINRLSDGSGSEPIEEKKLLGMDISADGRFIVFSTDLKLVPEDTDSLYDVYLYDRDRDGNGIFDEDVVGAIELIPNPSKFNHNYEPRMSEDGRYVAFNYGEIFIYDRELDVTHATTDLNTYNLRMDLSGNGKYVVFESMKGDYLDVTEPIQDTNGLKDIYMWAWETDEYTLISRSTGGEIANNESRYPSINTDGSVVTYESFANNLDDDKTETAFQWDVYMTTIDRGLPQWPSGSILTADTIGKNQVELSWTPATDNLGIAGYHLYQDNVEVTSASVTGEVYHTTIHGLQANTTYTFRVEAVDVSGNQSAGGPQVSVTTKGDEAKATLSAQVISNAIIQLSWDAVPSGSPITAYKLKRSSDGGTNYDLVKEITDLSETTYLDTGLVSNTTYTYQVFVDEPDVDTAYTDPVTVQTSNLVIEQMFWQIPRSGYPDVQAVLGETLSVQVKGEPNRIVHAELTLENWLDATTSAELANPEQRTVSFALTEETDNPGIYREELALPDGTSKLSDLKTVLSDGIHEGVFLQETLDLQVTGSLQLNLSLAGSSDILQKSRITVYSENLADGTDVAVGGNQTPLVEQLALQRS